MDYYFDKYKNFWIKINENIPKIFENSICFMFYNLMKYKDEWFFKKKKIHIETNNKKIIAIVNKNVEKQKINEFKNWIKITNFK